MIVYKSTDRVPVKIGDLTFWISPLRADQKLEIMSLVEREGGMEVVDQMKQSFLAVRYSVKEVEGLKNHDGSEYKLSLDDSGVMTDECLDDLLQLEVRQKIVDTCLKLLPGVQEIKIPGVKIDLKKVRSIKKK
jgi:hypothetical protein